MPETPCCAKPEAFIMGPLKESLLGMANPSLVTSEGKQPLFLTSDHTPLHGERGPEVGGRNRRPGCPQQRRGAQGLTDQHRGLCLFPNTLPASFPKRSEARLTGIPIHRVSLKSISFLVALCTKNYALVQEFPELWGKTSEALILLLRRML